MSTAEIATKTKTVTTKAARTAKPATKTAKRVLRGAAEAAQDTDQSTIGNLATSARQTATDLGRTGAEVLEDTRDSIDGAARRAGRLGREVYLAGLGAMATVDERGRAWFSDLVREGQKIAPRVASKRVPTPLRKAGDRLKKFGGRVEAAVGQGVQTGLERVGVPSRREIHQLTRRIEALSAKIDQLGA
jgi:poly(hydroxyalkanoate) granule-associated protein